MFIGDNLKKYVLVDMDNKFPFQYYRDRVQVEAEIALDEDLLFSNSTIAKIKSINY